MSTFYVRPFLPVEAFQFLLNEFLAGEYAQHPISDETGYPQPTIPTQWGMSILEDGDWVVKYPNGKYEVFSEEGFETYFTMWSPDDV